MTHALLNLGCGSFIHDDWTNVDFFSSNEKVIAHNLLLGVPFASDSFDAVYHSHVLEHFKKPDALPFIKECFRVLKPGGCLRVVVPDLEGICRDYLKWMELALQESTEAKLNYEWIVIELLDQLVREESGGEMAAMLTRVGIANLAYITQRIGADIKDSLDTGQARRARWPSKRALVLGLLQRMFGKHFTYYRVGRFRMSGESHKWMYDRFSMRELLLAAGFTDVQKRCAYESNIANFAKYGFEVYKEQRRGESSLFMEAIKPLNG